MTDERATSKLEPSDSQSAQPPTKQELSQRQAVRTMVRAGLSQAMPLLTLSSRYRHLTLSDMEWLLIAPLLQNRVGIAKRKVPSEEERGDDHTKNVGAAGIIIWAKVSEQVDAKIKEQVAAKVFPIKLKADEWNSGDRIWIFDIVAETVEVATHLFLEIGKAQAPESIMQTHPIISRLVNPDLLSQMKADR